MLAARPFTPFAAPPFYTRGMGGDVSQISSAVGSGLTTIAPFTGPAAPFVAAAGQIANLVAQVANLFQGCGQTCILATQIVNKVEPYLQQNLQLYLSNPNRTACDQAAHLAAFDQMWQYVVQSCGNASLGQAGQNCINDRGPNGCTWRNDGHGGPAGSGSVCWDWFIGYRDPIANDVPPGGNICTTSNTSANGQTGTTTTALEYSGLAAALVLILLVVAL